MTEATWIVWIGGVDDHYKTKAEALEAVEKWKSKGYDDVQLSKVGTILGKLSEIVFDIDSKTY